jgi:hypothetical protein
MCIPVKEFMRSGWPMEVTRAVGRAERKKKGGKKKASLSFSWKRLDLG